MRTLCTNNIYNEDVKTHAIKKWEKVFEQTLHPQIHLNGKVKIIPN
jgi:hypothetical protein